MITMQNIVNTTAANRASKITDDLLHLSALNRLLYGDTIPWSDRSIWFKIKWHISLWHGRVKDAWAVLIGNASIGGDY